MAAGERKCLGSNAKGTPCQAAPLSGSKWCRAHDPNLPDETRFGSPEQAGKAGASPKPRTLKLREELNRQVEEKAATIVDVLFDALLADKGVIVGSGETAFVELVPDHAVRLRAVQELFDRAEGKPRQALEHTGAEGGPIRTVNGLDLSKLTDEQIAALEAINADPE
jgi:hypothetical protein